jgi:phospholipid/cholesterol/gamma-HCH transport system permease protein
MSAWAQSVGREFLKNLDMAKGISLFFYLATRSTMRLSRQQLKPLLFTIISQIYFTGRMAIPIVVFVASIVGALTVIQANMHSQILGSTEVMGQILVIAIIREIGPLVTALLIIARSGTAVASELGNMIVNKEIDALRSLAIDPMAYIVFPRLLSGIISLICLAFFFNTSAFLSGFVVSSWMQDLSLNEYIFSLSNALSLQDLAMNTLKNALSGLLIFGVCSYKGLSEKVGPHEVPISTTEAVVLSLMLVISVHFALSLLSYMGEQI